MITSQKLASYYLQTLRQSALTDNPTSFSRHADIEPEEFFAGKITPQSVKKLFKGNTPQKSQEKQSLNVLIMPLIPNNTRNPAPMIIPASASSDGELTPLENNFPWIPRTLLSPILEDSEQGFVQPPIADLAQFNEQIKSNPFNTDDWSAFATQSAELFEHLTHQSLIRFRFNTRKPSTDDEPNQFRVVLGEQNAGMSSSIQGVYEKIISTKKNLPLFSTMVPKTSNTHQHAMTAQQLSAEYMNHLGQMAPEHGLTNTQRDALANYTALKSGQVLAISGPPGTGKTSLLQSVIATEWVQSAVAEEYPQVCVASSTNNQAVTNIIDSFTNAASLPEGNQIIWPTSETYKNFTDKQAMFADHWLPGNKTFGLYLVSAKKFNEVSDIDAKITSQNQQYLENLSTPESLTENTKAFLSNCRQLFPEVDASVENYRDELHEALLDVVDDIQLILDGRKRDFDGQTKKEETLLIQLKATLNQQEELLETNKQLLQSWYDYDHKNTTILDYLPIIGKKQAQKRRQNFCELNDLDEKVNLVSQLRRSRKAVPTAQAKYNQQKEKLNRLYQAKGEYTDAVIRNHIETNKPLDAQIDTNMRYLAFMLSTHYWEARWLLEQENLPQKETSQITKKRDWQIISMLTPCIVGTFYQVDKFFQDNHKQPMFNGIDLLVVDEAGQVSPEVALASFALAKKALVVGDTKQIQPIWTLEKNIDRVNMRQLVNFREDDIATIENTGFSVASGDLMSATQHQSSFIANEKNVKSIMLKEHFRCLPDIVDYFNKMSYNNQLIPMRSAPKDTPDWSLPQFGYAPLLGKAKKRNGSRYNEREAQAIARWIRENKTRLESMDHGQTTPLKDTIAIVTPFKEQSNTIKRELQKEGLKDEELTCGTIHALQGAERKVIIFSPVYDSNKTEFFFDKNTNMLNVAVSRAKDSFLYFGNVDILSMKGALPSAQLARKLFEHNSNEITGVSSFQPNERVANLTGAKAHDTWLIKELSQAQERVDISAPYISNFVLQGQGKPVLVAIKSCIDRGVSIVVHPSAEMNTEPNKKKGFYSGIETLQSLGVSIKMTHRRIHSKQILIDHHILADGSFNWLSARRQEGDKFYNVDTTTVIDDANLAEEFALEIFQDTPQKNHN
ncbi:AAA domain-containing protein [uncultured Lacticaseibacillus sp.]|uniref:AAA domain-containing protein n=1 Tax=uncultured Lacticaseibacillus sp. TaxID=2775882 RepID=UPI00259634E8|nr:AAA domain-containing protein [uncultured Lacticaseibacillus sp.]